MNESRRGPQHFQSFWYGGPLSPYECLCLKSFIDCGHAFDLYTYDPDLAVPAGVRVCDASELFDRNEVFVYQADGFGKGSPSAFSNLFRAKLWWKRADGGPIPMSCASPIAFPSSPNSSRAKTRISSRGASSISSRAIPSWFECLDEVTKLGRTVKCGRQRPGSPDTSAE